MNAQASTARPTRQRAAIAALLDRTEDFRTAQELHDQLRRNGDSIGLTTVYRTLQSLADSGAVDMLRTATGEAMYRRCATVGHHHHLVCRRCGTTVEIKDPTVESWTRKVAEWYRFSELSHTVDIFGLCRACSAR